MSPLNIKSGSTSHSAYDLRDPDAKVIFDCRVEKHENCFPMIPSGKRHTEMLPGDADIKAVIGAKGAVWV